MAVNTLDKFDIGYPLFGSKFVYNDRIVVCGGGGEGKNGIKNKISVLSIDDEDENPLSIDREIELPDNEDNPTSLDVFDGNIYAGINRSDDVIKAKKNDHLRVFQLKDGKLKKSHVVFNSGSLDEYQKVTAACSTLVAICSSANPGTLYVLSTRNMRQSKYTQTTESGEINDLHFSPDEKHLAFCTDKKLVVLEAGTGKEVHNVDVPWNDKTFSKVRFTSDNTLIAALTLAGRKGSLVAKFNIETGELVDNKKVNTIKAPTAMDAKSKYIAIAGADLSIAIVSTESLKTLHVMPNVHPFAITSVSLNEKEDLLASTSVANILHVAELPEDGEFHRDRASFIWAISSIVLTIIIAVLFQLLIKYQIIDSLVMHDKIWDKLDSMKAAQPLVSKWKSVTAEIAGKMEEIVHKSSDSPSPIVTEDKPVITPMSEDGEEQDHGDDSQKSDHHEQEQEDFTNNDHDNIAADESAASLL